MGMDYTLRGIGEQIGAEISGSTDACISGVNTLEAAQPGQLTYAEHAKYAPQVLQTQASAVIVPKSFPTVAGKTLLRVEHPRLAFLQVMSLFQPRPSAGGGIDPRAAVADDATLGEGVTIRPYAVIGARARIGARTVIESGVHLGEGVVVGEACLLGPNVVVMYGCQLGNRVAIHAGTVIGGDGFGYVFDGGRHYKVPQLGDVVIEDDVEIGCNVCVDRATLGSTIIRQGTKIDNLVQIAHNNIIGRHVILTGQCGLAGSVTVGDYAVFGGRTAVTDHVTIGAGSRAGFGSVIIKSVPAGETVFGYPARPSRRAKRELASLAHLPKLIRKVAALCQQLQAPESRAPEQKPLC
jgi:UDP-3-O-[3-hydroxymyristoyl] glucosamine N-acyltransferase